MSKLIQIPLILLLTNMVIAEANSESPAFMGYSSTNSEPKSHVPKSYGPISYGDVVVDKVIHVHDGDSFKVNIQAWPSIIGKEIIIRIKGIDAPEMQGNCEKENLMAKLARQHTVNMIDNAFRVELKEIQRDRYFRILADVFVDRINLGDSLVSNKFAVRYVGGKKHDWCN